MNYYIQGDAANAGKIKAAFEAKGYKCAHNCDSMNFLYYTINNHVTTTGIQSHTRQLIMRLAELGDYSELKLPVEPKFKVGDKVIYKGNVRTITFMDEVYYDFDGGVAGCRIEKQDELLSAAPKFKIGDWIACDADSFTLSIKSVRDVNYYFHQGESLPIKYIDEHYHLWSIADAKDGDVLAINWHEDNDSWEKIIIFKNYHAKGVKGLTKGPCVEGYGNTFKNGKLAINEEVPYYSKTWTHNLQPATKEQRDLLFQKMKENGCEWDADKKELKKIQPHYDIKNFHVGTPVLVREYDTCHWQWVQYSHFNGVGLFFAAGKTWRQCIPFNDDTKHLLGTTDMPDEIYINW